MKSGNLNFLESSGPLQACNGTNLPYLRWDFFRIHMLWICVLNHPTKCGYIILVYGAASLMFLFLLNSHINLSSTNWNMQDLTFLQQYYRRFVSFWVLGFVDCSAVADILQDCWVFTFRVKHTKQRGLLFTDNEGTAIPQSISQHLHMNMLQCPRRF